MARLNSFRIRLIGLMSVGVVASVIILASCSSEQVAAGPEASKSAMLQEVERQFDPQVGLSQKNGGSIYDILMDFIDFLGDVADVAIADIEGVAKGAGIGGAVGVVIYGPDQPEERRNAAIIGALVYGAAASVKEVEKKTADSLKVPSNSPYNSGSKPTSSDSLGWLHNQAVRYAYHTRMTSPTTPIRVALRTWAVAVRGYDATLMDSLLTAGRVDALIADVEGTTTHASFITSLVTAGLSAEASDLSSLYSDLSDLQSQSYTNAAAITLIQLYKSNVVNLSISQDRKDDYKRLLGVYEYCYMIYSENVGDW